MEVVDKTEIEKPQSEELIRKIRAAGISSDINVLNISDSKESLKELIMYPISCNGVNISALVDTGARVSVIDVELVKREKWNKTPFHMGIMQCKKKLLRKALEPRKL